MTVYKSPYVPRNSHHLNCTVESANCKVVRIATKCCTKSFVILVSIVLLERMAGRERASPPPGTPFHARSNELLLVSIALALVEGFMNFHRSGF